MSSKIRGYIQYKAAAIACLLCMASQAPAASPDDALRRETGRFSVKATDIIQYQLPQPGGPDIEYFISRPAQAAPLMLFIQGSGCTPVFIGLGTPGRASTVFSYITFAVEQKYAVMVVNKPLSPKTQQAGGGGGAATCPDAFNEHFTLDNWVRELRLALAHARQLPWVAPGRALVFGISEGATVAAALAADDKAISHVALLGASGPTQLYDFVVAAYKSPGGDEEIKQKLDELDATRKLIFASPDSAKDFAWGHPYKRWSSFFRASSTNNLLKSQAKVYIVSGMQDMSVPILSTESMASELQVAGRDVTVRRLPKAAHNLLQPGGQYADIETEYRRILNWFEQDR